MCLYRAPDKIGGGGGGVLRYFEDIFVEPAGDERDIVATTSVRYICVRQSGFVRAIISTLMHEFQNNLEPFKTFFHLG